MAKSPPDPPLSIGLPVFNGERYLPKALLSLVDQTWSDFELIVCDNASTDKTEEICRAFASADPRIRYVRNAENIGVSGNFMRTLYLARGHFFKWASHDDVCAPTFVARCIEGLQSNPDIVLCHTESRRIDAEGRMLGFYEGEAEAMEDVPWRRFRRMIRTPHLCIPIFGLTRTELLRQTSGIGPYVGSDRNLLAELALRGKILLIPEALFDRRQHRKTSVGQFPDERARLRYFDPQNADRRSFPTWRRMAEYFASIQRAPLSTRERLLCMAQLGAWISGRHHTGVRNARLMMRELVT